MIEKYRIDMYTFVSISKYPTNLLKSAKIILRWNELVASYLCEVCVYQWILPEYLHFEHWDKHLSCRMRLKIWIFTSDEFVCCLFPGHTTDKNRNLHIHSSEYSGCGNSVNLCAISLTHIIYSHWKCVPNKHVIVNLFGKLK